MNIDLQEWHTRYLLEALRLAETHLAASAEASSNEDVKADIGNDMMRFTALHDHIERVAVAAYGPAIRDFEGTVA
jgi:hypothetical protein